MEEKTMRISKSHFSLAAAIGTLYCTTLAGQTLPVGASVERLATGYSFTEGPVYDGKGSLYFANLYFSATPSQIVRYDESTGTSEIVDQNSGMANGMYLDQHGHIVSMDMGRAQVSRRGLDDISVVDEVLASEWNGREFNSTNDLVIAEDGGIYFSDPDYLSRNAQPEAVYYLSPSGELSQVISGFRRPNGIVLSPDGGTLYLAVSEESRIMAYDVGADGLPSKEREFAKTSGGPDGLTVDPAGNLYAAVGGTVSVWDSLGQPLFKLPVPEPHVSNVTFGGTEGRTLYITASSSLYGIELLTPDPAADCNVDWVLNASDLSCVSTIAARDVILDGLNTLPGDLDGNGDISFPDFLRLSTNFGAQTSIYTDGDINLKDGVTFDDFLVLSENFGQTPSNKAAAAVPEPAGILIATSCFLGVLKWRRMMVGI
jgi:gluconolactonase